jgi:hypothetical protein
MLCLGSPHHIITTTALLYSTLLYSPPVLGWTLSRTDSGAPRFAPRTPLPIPLPPAVKQEGVDAYSSLGAELGGWDLELLLNGASSIDPFFFDSQPVTTQSDAGPATTLDTDVALLDLHQRIVGQYHGEQPDEADPELPTLNAIEVELEKAHIRAIPRPDTTAWVRSPTHTLTKEEFEALIENTVPQAALLLPRRPFNMYNTMYGMRPLLHAMDSGKGGIVALTEIRKKLQGKERARDRRKKIKTKRLVHRRWRKARLTVPLLRALKAMATKSKGSETGDDSR